MSSRTTVATRATVSASLVAWRRGDIANDPARRATLSMSPAIPAAASTPSSSRPGVGLGRHSSPGSACTGSGLESKTSMAKSTAARPSAIAWWSLATIPTRPSSRRGASTICHSGRLRSSGTEKAASVSEAKLARLSDSSSSDSATTCREMSKLVSSTQNGSPKPGGGNASRWRKRGARCSLPRMLSRSELTVGRSRSGWGSKRAHQPTCIWAFGVSTRRNEPSSGRRRGRIIPSSQSGRPVGPTAKVFRSCGFSHTHDRVEKPAICGLAMRPA